MNDDKDNGKDSESGAIMHNYYDNRALVVAESAPTLCSGGTETNSFSVTTIQFIIIRSTARLGGGLGKMRGRRMSGWIYHRPPAYFDGNKQQ